MRSFLLILALLLALPSGTAHAAECPTELKPTDTYKELSATLKCLNDRIKAFEAQRGASAKSGNAPDVPPPASGFKATILKGTASTSAGRYQLDVVKCQRAREYVKCSLSVTSRGKDGSAYIAESESRLFDTQGRDFTASSADIGGVSTDRGSSRGKDLIADLPTVASVEFPADNGVTGIAVLRVHLCGDGIQCETLSFRNLAIN